jgi:hypothetical protein
LNSLCQALQSYKIENALLDHLQAYDAIIQDESIGRECFRSNDFARIHNFDELMKCYKTDYPPTIESESSLDHFFSVSSHLNPDIVNYLDNLDEVIGKAFKFSEPEELFQTTSKKKTQKIKKVGKSTTATTGGGRRGKKGEFLGDEEGEEGDRGDQQPLDGEGNELPGKKVSLLHSLLLHFLIVNRKEILNWKKVQQHRKNKFQKVQNG